MTRFVLAACGLAGLAAAGVAVPVHGRSQDRAVDVPKADITVTTDLDYVSTAEYPNKKDRLDVYAPANAPKGGTGAPVVVSIHGGALREGDKSGQAFVGQRFAAAGFVTIVINYRLSPSVMHPAHVEDAAHAVAWARSHAAEYGGDPKKLFVIGHSAGAYLAALLTLDPKYLAAYQMSAADLKGVVPVSAFFYVDRKGVAPDRPKDVWGTDTAVWKAASPASYLRKEAPPMLLLYADGDDEWRRQQQADFLADMKKAGAKAIETKMIAGRTHGSIWSQMKNANDETASAIIAFLKAH
jgi:acetyl esterase/lipase